MWWPCVRHTRGLPTPLRITPVKIRRLVNHQCLRQQCHSGRRPCMLPPVHAAAPDPTQPGAAARRSPLPTAPGPSKRTVQRWGTIQMEPRKHAASQVGPQSDRQGAQTAPTPAVMEQPRRPSQPGQRTQHHRAPPARSRPIMPSGDVKTLPSRSGPGFSSMSPAKSRTFNSHRMSFDRVLDVVLQCGWHGHHPKFSINFNTFRTLLSACSPTLTPENT